VRYDESDKPVVSADGSRLRVSVLDQVLLGPVDIKANAVVLSTGIAPNNNQALADALGVPLDSDGFFQEQHPKMRPLNLLKPGLFLCGLAHGPHFISETIAQAQGAAMRAAAYLAQSPRAGKPTRVRVNKRLCSFCGLCVSACPYGARVLDYDERVAQVLPELCQGCGICAVTCPNKATQQQAYEHKPILAEVDAAVLGV
jgi:heterodisulfide reductase subunit A-like polyferredoxin